MPRATMIAGPNGSGKSTLIELLIARGIPLGEYLNADDIAAASQGDPREANERAQAIVRERRETARSEQRDYAWETVMSHPSHIEHLVDARRAGYEIWVFYVATEDERVSRLRVAERAERGGHGVPETKITERYFKSLARLPYALAVSDYAAVYDNSSADMPFRLLCEIRRERMTLHEEYEAMPAWFQRTLRFLVERGDIDL